MRNFIGSGWAFPPQLDHQHRVVLATGEDKIAQAIWIILSTPIGQRVMRPTFGSRLHELVFAPANAETYGLAARYAAEALRFWEPRIEVLAVEANPDPGRAEVLLITIHYRIKQSYDERSLVFPFYKIPGEARTHA